LACPAAGGLPDLTILSVRRIGQEFAPLEGSTQLPGNAGFMGGIKKGEFTDQ
jgi:hypothetical protein